MATTDAQLKTGTVNGSGPTASAVLPAMHVLVLGLSAGVLAQGGYHGPGRLVLVVAVGAAGVLALVGVRLRAAELRSPLVLAAGGLAAWAVVRGAASSQRLSGGPLALLLAGVVVVLLVVARLRPRQRHELVRGLMVLGVVVAATGWIGVVWHREPWGLSNDGVWRAAASLTYANAAAAVLVPLLLLSVGRLLARPGDGGRAVTTAALLVGAVATLSRAGAISLGCGALVLVVLAGPRRVAAAATAPVLGAAIAVGGMTGSLSLASAPGRPVAVVATAVGLCSAAAVTRLRAPVRAGVLAAVLGLGVAALVGVHGQWSSLSAVLAVRVEAGPSPRVHAAESAVNLVAEHPLAGVGPGSSPVIWPGEDGSAQVMRYVHDEYLEVLLTLGAPGLALLLALLAAAGASLRRAHKQLPTSALAAAVSAALAAAAVHAAFDFVWQVPVVPLLLAALLGLVTERPSARTGPSSGDRPRPTREVE
jgi:O-Antigen ligase